MNDKIGLLGILILVFIGYLFSLNRKKIDWKLVGTAIILQFILALLVLGIPSLGFSGPLKFIFVWANDVIISILNFTDQGSAFIFGRLVSDQKNFGFIFAFRVLPTIIFMGTLMGVLYYLKIMPILVNLISKGLRRVMNISGAESLSMAANVFVGQTEAPLVVKPYIPKMTLSELMTVMTGGMATVAGGVMASYVGMLKDSIPNIAGHLLTASVMSAPAALMMAKIIVPETETSETRDVTIGVSDNGDVQNIIDAAARGAGEGLQLALNVGAMLLAFIALIAMIDGILGWVGELIQFSQWGVDLVPSELAAKGAVKLNLSLILGWIFSPIAWVMGIPTSEIQIAGALLGEKVALNEFLAYQHLSESMNGISERTSIILSYALCGFANFSSIAIQIGGIGGLAPGKKSDLARLGMLSVLGGTIAAFLTATIAGLLI